MDYLRILDIEKFDDVTSTFNDPKTMLDKSHEYYYEKPIIYTPIVKRTRLHFAVIDWTNGSRHNGEAADFIINKLIESDVLRPLETDEKAKLMLMDMNIK